MITAWYDKELDNSNFIGGSNTVIKIEVKRSKAEVLDLVDRINKEVKNRSASMINIVFDTEWYAIMLVYCSSNELYSNIGVIDFITDKSLDEEDMWGDKHDFIIAWKDSDFV